MIQEGDVNAWRIWRKWLGLAALLLTLMPTWAQEPLCDDRRPYQSWHNCAGSVVLSSGMRYEGLFKQGVPSGLGSALFTNGFRYIGEFQNGQYHGTGALVDRGFKVLQAGLWAEGKFVEGRSVDLATLLPSLRQGLPAPTQTMAATATASAAPTPTPPRAPVDLPAPLPAPQTMAQPAPAPAPPSATVRANPAVDAPVAMSQRPALAQAAPLPSPPAAHLQFANRRALVIGNDNYRSVDPLKNAVSDARAMAAALERSGYKVSLHLDLDEKRFKQALRTFRYEVQGGDEVMFFFAGHGVEIAGANFLLPVDIRVSGTDNDKDRDQLREDSIDLKRFMSDLEERKTKFALAVIDACREDPFPKEKGSRSISTKGGLAQTTPATGQMIIFSAGAGQLAIDSLGANDPSKNGLFTRVFLSEMDKPGVPVDRVLKNVRTEVSRLAKTMGRTQTPAIYDQSEGDFYFRLR